MSADMIKVKLRTILNFKKIIGKGEVDFPVEDGTNLEAALDKIVETYGEELKSNLFDPDNGNLLQHIRLMVNGRDIAFLNGLQTILQDGDEILILPPVAGG